MRLSEIRVILQENLPALSVNVQNADDTKFRHVEGIRSAMAALENISVVPSLERLSTELLNNREISSIWSDDAVMVPRKIADHFLQKLAHIKNECQTILSLADSILPSADENYLCVRLSDAIFDLSGLKKLVDSLEKAFQFTYGVRKYPGKIRFAGVEAGTNWLNLLVEGVEYASLIYLLVHVAYEVVRDYYDLEMLKKKHEGIDVLNQIMSSNANLVRELNESLLTRRMNGGELDVSPEEFSRLSKASMEFSRMVMEGNKILLSIDAPKEKQAGLLDVAKQIDSRIGEVRQLEGPKHEE